MFPSGREHVCTDMSVFDMSILQRPHERCALNNCMLFSHSVGPCMEEYKEIALLFV